jgi:hypothetical protein
MPVVSASSKCPKSIIQERNETGSSVKQLKGFWGIVAKFKILGQWRKSPLVFYEVNKR